MIYEKIHKKLVIVVASDTTEWLRTRWERELRIGMGEFTFYSFSLFYNLSVCVFVMEKNVIVSSILIDFRTLSGHGKKNCKTWCQFWE